MSNQLDLTSLRDALASLRRGLARWQPNPAAEVAAVIPAFESHAQALLVLLQSRNQSDA